MRKKFIIHVGTHKTGTTAIQLTLTRARSLLESKGVCYPQIGCPEYSRFGQHLLAWSLFDNEDYLPRFNGNRISVTELQEMRLWPLLVNYANDSESKNFIISSEEFSILGCYGVSKLKAYLSEFEVEVVVYLRRQDKFLESAYSTAVLYNEERRNFFEFSENQRTNLDYSCMVSVWEDAFGKESINVRSYENKQLRRDVVGDFLTMAGLLSLGIDSREENGVNARVDANAIEVIRGLRLRGWSEIRLRLLRDKFSEVYLKHGKRSSSSFMDKLQRNNLLERYACSNSTLLERYGCDLLVGPDEASDSVICDFHKSLEKVFGDVVDFCFF